MKAMTQSGELRNTAFHGGLEAIKCPVTELYKGLVINSIHILVLEHRMIAQTRPGSSNRMPSLA